MGGALLQWSCDFQEKRVSATRDHREQRRDGLLLPKPDSGELRDPLSLLQSSGRSVAANSQFAPSARHGQ